jgi:hypothetical protein
MLVMGWQLHLLPCSSSVAVCGLKMVRVSGRRSCLACHVNLIRAARPTRCCTVALLATVAVCCVLSAQKWLMLPADPTKDAMDM